MNPQQRAEYEHEHYGWRATTSRLERHQVELLEAVQAWNERDRERPETHYGLALEIERVGRNLSAETSHLARLSGYQRQVA